MSQLVRRSFLAVFVGVLPLVGTLGAHAGVDPPAVVEAKRKALVERVERFADKHGTLRTRFVQTISVRNHDRTTVRRGELAIRRPGSIAFRYDDGDWVVGDGTWIHAFVGEHQTEYVMKASAALHPAAVAFFANTDHLDDHFTLRRIPVPDDPDHVVLEAAPKAPHPAFVRMWLLVTRTSGAVTRVMVVDAQGNTNRFVLENPRYGTSIPDRTFRRPKLPKGTKTVRP